MSKITDAMNSIGDAASSFGSSAKKIMNDLATPISLDKRSTKTGTFNTGQYNVTSHSYPADLLSPTGSYGGNYAIFYINVAIDSKLIGQLGESGLVGVDDIPARDRGDLIAMNISKDKLVATQTVTAVGGAVLAKIGLGTGAGATATVAGAAVVGASVTASQAASANRAQRRLKTAIALHIPNQLSIRYGVNWSDDDTAAFQMIATGGSEIMNALNSKDTKQLGENAKKAGSVGASIISNLALSKGPNASAMSAATGLAANPKKEQVFKGVDFRTFSFDYQFFPRSEPEAANVLNIIKEFKYHMHPEFKDANNFLYIYPSEFDISYYQNGEENTNLHRHTSCVLQEMTVNYTPNGAFTTFPNGMPTQINITLTFRELALLTKDKVEDGL
jgi:hypothetical protein